MVSRLVGHIVAIVLTWLHFATHVIAERPVSLLQKATSTATIVASAEDDAIELNTLTGDAKADQQARSQYDVAAVNLLKAALKEDPSSSASLSLSGSADGNGGGSYCFGRACAQPSCGASGRELHDLLEGVQCNDNGGGHQYSVPTSSTLYNHNGMLWDNVLQASDTGKLCKVCDSGSDGVFSVVVDQTDYSSVPLSMDGCYDPKETGGDLDPSMPAYDDFGQQLMLEGKLQFKVHQFDYVYGGRTYKGRMHYAILLPPHGCPAGGCQTVLFLHGIKPFQYMELDPDNLLFYLQKLPNSGLQWLCETAYNSLEAVYIVPILDNMTFEAANLTDGNDVDYYQSRVSQEGSKYTWYNTYVDVFGDALVPLLNKELDLSPGLLNRDRVALTGVSMGGVASLLGAMKHPEVFESVVALSPCNQKETYFPDAIYTRTENLYGNWDKPGNRLRHVLTYIGESDTFFWYPAAGAGCANEWANIFDAAKLTSSRSSGGVHVEMRVVPNRYNATPGEDQEMNHLATVSFAMMELETVLWADDQKGLSCAMDISWLPFAILVAALIIFMFFESRGAGVSVTSSGIDTVVGATATNVGGACTYTSGHLTMKARPIPTLLELLPADSDSPALLNTRDNVVVSYSALRAYLSGDETVSTLPEGLRYAILLPAGHLLACVLLAVINRGTAVPLDPSMTEQELNVACMQMKVQVVVCAADSSGDVPRAVASSLGLAVVVSEPSKDGPCPSLRVAPGFRRFARSTQKWNAQDESRVVLLLRTSGTTSKGKVVPFQFARLARAAQYNAACVGLATGEICLSMMPLYHIAGISVNLLPSLHAGAAVLILGGVFEAKHFITQLERSPGTVSEGAAPSWYFAVPSVHASVISEAESLGRPLKHRIRLIRSAGAALDPVLGRKLVSFFGASVTPCYGMTEACEITCPPMDYQVERDGSVGPAMTCEIKIDTKGSQILSGEVCVKGDMLMKTYEWDGAPEDDPNVESWTADGYLRTGDVGHLDSDGWLYLTGRSKEMINRGGETLSPYEVEEAVQSVPGLSFCLAFAAPHSSLGECIAVACVLKDGVRPEQVSLSVILEECAQRGLRPVMRPEVVIYCTREALPMTRTKKYIRTGLAGNLGLTNADMLETCRAFQHRAGYLQPVPAADVDRDIVVQDSMGQLQTATRSAFITQNVVNALYGICIVNVMLNHWLPHSLSDYPMPEWTKAALTTFRSDKALMALVFALSGHSAANWPRSSVGRRIAAFVIIYILMGWPKLSESTEGIATFHRWFIYWLVICVALCHACEGLRVPGFAVILLAWGSAPLLRGVGDNLGSFLVPHYPFLMDPYHFWSIGHKVYWLGFFSLGFFYGNLVPSMVEKAPTWWRQQLQAAAVRTSFFGMAVCLAFALVRLDEPHDDSLEDTLADWPNFFNRLYPFKLISEVLQISCLIVAVQQGNAVMRTLGASILGSFIVHMYLDTGIKAFAESRTFQAMDLYSFPGTLQMAVILAYPIVFGLTVGRLMMYLFTLVFSRVTAPEKTVT